MLDRKALIALVEDRYFFNVDNKNVEPAVACFAADAELRVQSAHVSHTGHGQIRRMFKDFMAATKTIYHGDFSHVVDVDNQWIASQFVARNDYDDGRRVEMRNCNFFQVEDGRFKRVTIYMTDENPLV